MQQRSMVSEEFKQKALEKIQKDEDDFKERYEAIQKRIKETFAKEFLACY